MASRWFFPGVIWLGLEAIESAQLSFTPKTLESLKASTPL